MGNKAITNWDVVIEYFDKIKRESTQSYINSLYNKARILANLFEGDKQVLQRRLLEALKCYSDIRDFLNIIKKEKKILEPFMQHQLNLCKDFCEMLPVRIHKLGC